MPGAEALRAYHDSTKHTVESVYAGGPVLDWANEPERFKVYLDIRPRSLPPFGATGTAWHRALRASAGDGGSRRVDPVALSHLLFHAGGISRELRGPGGSFQFRTHASAGALYPIEMYVVTDELEGLEAGVYHYAPRHHGLHQLRTGDHRGDLGLAGASPGETAVVLTGIPWRTAWKYGSRGFRHLYWDAGMVMANLLGAAGALGIRARVRLGFIDGSVDAVLGLDGLSEFGLAVVALGEGDAAATEDLSPMELRVAPTSPHPVRDPRIEEARAGVALRSAREVEAFRASQSRDREDPGPPATTLSPLPDQELSADPFEVVVRRRGSSRKLARAPFPAAEYGALLDVALAGVSGDVPDGRPEAYVVASALEGLPPGAYLYEPGGRFVLIRRGSLRSLAGHLCLDQRLGADAAATTFLSADLESALEDMGGRGYAVAQLGAAVAAGRMYLGGYGQRLGVTGLTFFDDEVRQLFTTRAEPMLAVAMGPEGRRRLGR
jgi:SagB-type dehydrogenase family enzyme